MSWDQVTPGSRADAATGAWRWQGTRRHRAPPVRGHHCLHLWCELGHTGCGWHCCSTSVEPASCGTALRPSLAVLVAAPLSCGSGAGWDPDGQSLLVTDGPCVPVVPPPVLLDEIEAAELEGNDDRIEGVLCGAVKQLKVTRAKPDSTLYLSLMYLAKIKPNIFATEGVIEVRAGRPLPLSWEGISRAG